MSALSTFSSLCVNAGVLPGLVCTENDLAYLQRMKNIKQYEELQVVVS